jgi:Tol biopolymer transport system component
MMVHLNAASVPGLLALQVVSMIWACVPAAALDDTLGPPQQVTVAAIPAEAELVFHQDGGLFAMDRHGQHVTQLWFGAPRGWEHVAASPDRRYLAANEQLPNSQDRSGGASRIWLIDLAQGTERQVLPAFETVGNGGVDWDREGFIYFAGKDTDVVAQPKRPEEFLANAGANDVYKIRYDGSGLQRLTNTPRFSESDVSVSEDGTLVAYNGVVLDPANTVIELWVAGSDGSRPRRVLTSGKPFIDSTHDPELSPDNTRLVFSQVNHQVPPNFPDQPAANTAHDIWMVALDGSGLTRLTPPGPISIAPDWRGDLVLYMELNDAEDYLGASLIEVGQQPSAPRRLRPGAQMLKWIP